MKRFYKKAEGKGVRLIVSLIAALLACATPAAATMMSGDALYENCLSTISARQALCLGYVAGVIDVGGQADVTGRSGEFRGERWCVPRGATLGEAQAAVAARLSNNPGHRSFDARFLVGSALAEAWPCRR
jgi:hypothetical protein